MEGNGIKLFHFPFLFIFSGERGRFLVFLVYSWGPLVGWLCEHGRDKGIQKCLMFLNGREIKWETTIARMRKKLSAD